MPIDLFFTSLAEVHQSHSIGVVLSGTASDGTKGLKAIKDCGGITFAHEESSAAYGGMPHSAIQAGVVNFILPPEEIPQKLIEITKIIKGQGIQEDQLVPAELDIYKQVLSILRLSIKDFGIGIDKKDQEKIFDRFYRVEGKSENVFAGFGIGLFIASSNIERHHGSITGESEIGKGSLFTITLPVSLLKSTNGIEQLSINPEIIVNGHY